MMEKSSQSSRGKGNALSEKSTVSSLAKENASVEKSTGSSKGKENTPRKSQSPLKSRQVNMMSMAILVLHPLPDLSAHMSHFAVFGESFRLYFSTMPK